MLELVTALAIIGVISTIATPSFLTWRENYKLKGVAREVNSIMQRIRTEAIKRNTTISIEFTNNTYTAFIDDGEGGGTAKNSQQDGSETTLLTGNFPSGVTLKASMSSSTTSTGYNSKGLALKIGNIHVSGDFTERSYQVVLSSAGHTRIIEG